MKSEAYTITKKYTINPTYLSNLTAYSAHFGSSPKFGPENPFQLFNLPPTFTTHHPTYKRVVCGWPAGESAPCLQFISRNWKIT
jgi:hypothetical protein